MTSSSGPGRGRRATIADVARAAGVSKGAVSFALNGRPGVSEETRRRILDTAAELGWRPRASAKALSVGRALAIGLILSRPPASIGSDPFLGQLLAGIEERLGPAGYVLVLRTVGDEEEIPAYQQLAADGRVDGMILTDARADDPRVGYLSDIGMPAVVVGESDADCPFPRAWADEAPAIGAAIRHLVARGHERIAHVSGTPGLLHAEARRQIWRNAVIESGLQPGRSVTGRFAADVAKAATRTLLTDDTPPTAIFYASDVMAVAGMSAAHEMGRMIPDDLAVVGFDDIPLAGAVSPSLSTVHQDHAASGRAAARMLLGQLDGGPPLHVEVASPRFIARASTGGA